MAAHHVAHLVGQQHPELVLGEELERGGVDHDERMVHPVGAGVEHRRLGDVELGNLGPVEGGDVLDVEGVEPGELVGAGAHRVPLEEEPDAALPADEGDDLPDRLVEPGHGAERLQGGTVGGMLPRDARDAGEGDAGPGGGDGGHGRDSG